MQQFEHISFPSSYFLSIYRNSIIFFISIFPFPISVSKNRKNEINKKEKLSWRFHLYPCEDIMSKKQY